MAFHTYKIEHYPKDSSGAYVSSPTEVDNVIGVNVTLAAGESADSFSFRVVNDDTDDMESISIDDRVKVYGSLDGTNFELLIDGMINEKESLQNPDQSNIIFKGLNRLEKLFNALVSTSGEGIPHESSYWVKNIIGQVNLFNNSGGTNRSITYNQTGTTIVETTEKISFVRNFDKAFKLIEELSQPKYTGGINYVYGVDENNQFYYKPRPATNTGTLTFGENILGHRTKKGMYDIVNYIIMNGGRSPFRSSILQMGYRADSISKYGWKVKLVNESISSDLLTEEVKNMKTKGVYQEDSVFPSGYDYKTSWNDTVTSDSDYNDSFVDVVFDRAKNKIDQMLDVGGSASYRMSVQVEPAFGYALYNNYTMVVDFNGTGDVYDWSSGVVLRLKTIAYSFNTQGWRTNLSFDQDTEKAT